MLKRIRLWGVYLIGFTIIVLMVWDVLISDHGYFVYHEEQMEMKQLNQDIIRIKEERELLKAYILRLRQDPKTLEEVIHRELGYVYPDEYMLIMPKQHRPQAASDAHDELQMNLPEEEITP